MTLVIESTRESVGVASVVDSARNSAEGRAVLEVKGGHGSRKWDKCGCAFRWSEMSIAEEKKETKGVSVQP